MYAINLLSSNAPKLNIKLKLHIFDKRILKMFFTTRIKLPKAKRNYKNRYQQSTVEIPSKFSRVHFCSTFWNKMMLNINEVEKISSEAKS